MQKLLVDEDLFDILLSKSLDYDLYEDLPPEDDKYYNDKEDYYDFLLELLVGLILIVTYWLDSREGQLYYNQGYNLPLVFFQNLDKSLTDYIYTNSDRISDFIRKFFTNGLKDGYSSLNLPYNASYLDLIRQRALSFVEHTNFDYIQNVSNTLKEDIRKTLEEGIREGKSVDEIKKSLEELPIQKSATGKFSPAQRAEMIAKTEYMRAYHSGVISVFEEYGVEYVNIINHGGNVCDYCIDLNSRNPWKIEDAKYLIPAHPRCKCTFEPVVSSEFNLQNFDYNYTY